DDNIDVEHVSLSTELQTMLNPLKDPLEEESMPAKPEAISDVESNNSYTGPMGLLQRIGSNRDVDDDEEENEETDAEANDDDDGNCSVASHGNDAERWQSWMKRWPWLLHEDSDGDFAFCLYCNVLINVNRHISYVQQHNLSLYHQERENNYVAFKNSEHQTDNNEVKYEMGSNEYIAAMKKRRANEVSTLNNFNWERWLKWHAWLERIQTSGTIGLCKCCNIRMNVEFVYLRKRHEVGKGHREAWRQYESDTSRKRKRSPSPEDKNTETEAEPKGNSAKKPAEEPVIMTVVDSGVETPDPSDWCELLPDTTPQQCRCTLCDCRMAISSFMRHLKTKVHCNNLQSQKRNSLLKLDRGVWAQYADAHPWLVADPNDPTMAYCHVCCRRFMYGHSEIKRKTHENSEKHQAAVTAAATVAGADVEESPTDAIAEQSEPEHSSAQSESVGSDEDYAEADARLSTTKTSPKNTADATRKTKHQSKVRHYSWLRYTKDRKIQLCKFCRVRFHNESSKLRHDQSARHKKLMQQFKERQATRRQQVELKRKKTNNPEEDEEEESNSDAPTEADKGDADAKTTSHSTVQVAAKAVSKKTAANRVPTSMRGKVMVWKDRFPWLSYKRSEKRSNYGWCKLCEASVFIPSFKIASRHQRSSRHIRLRLERKRLVGQIAAGSHSMATATAAALATGEARHKAAMAELQAKYNWLEADATDENHCHCKVCDARLPIKVFYLRQHDGSRKHAEHVERLKTSSEAAGTDAPVEQPQEVNMEVDQDSDGALSVKSEGSTVEQSGSKRSRRSAEMRRVLRVLRDSFGKRNEERSQIEMAKDMICSSFDIVQRLRTLERDSEPPATSPVRQERVAHTAPTPPRDTIDLFLDSISQTMKSLPLDLAAEGKSKIMQIVCSLELRSMRRTTSTSTTATKQSDAGTTETTENLTPRKDSHDEQHAFNEAFETIPDSPDSESSSVIIDEQFYEVPAHLQMQRNSSSDATSHLSEITLTTAPRVRKSFDQSPSKATISPVAATSAAAAATLSNGRSKEVPVNIRRILPSTVQVGSKPDQMDKVRLVPMDKLT
ncbi:hypothetical protein KR044_002052, partial [Drosophila immigrans]